MSSSGLSSSCPDDVARCTRGFLNELRSAELQPFLGAWPMTVQRRPVKPASLPVLRWIDGLECPESLPTAALVREVRHAASSLAWRQSYGASEVEAQFLQNYGWAEIVGLSGAIPSQRLACGFLLLGPRTHYPPHRHEAEEIYIPLAGSALWRKGEPDWSSWPPGSIIHHACNEPHSMRTGDHPLLALYLWRSEHLDQQSRLDL